MSKRTIKIYLLGFSRNDIFYKHFSVGWKGADGNHKEPYIFTTKKLARAYIKFCGLKYDIIPATITYELPKKRPAKQ